MRAISRQPSWMYAFEELCPKSDFPFCYLVGVLKKWPPLNLISADFFTSQFEWLMNVEDQSTSVWKTRRNCLLTRKFVMPTAPLTMTSSWSPFLLAARIMPEILQHGRTDGAYTSAYAIFNPVLKTGEVVSMLFGGNQRDFELPVCDGQLEFENIHAHHFFWLLEMTVARAQQLKKPVIVAGLPGFGYDHYLEHDVPSAARVRLLEAGYLYPSRLPQGARFSFLTDPQAREQRRAKLEALKPFNTMIPPPPTS